MAIVEDFSGDLSEYTGDVGNFTIVTSDGADGTSESLEATEGFGITHTSWQVEYDNIYRFWIKGTGPSDADTAGVYVGDSIGGINDMNGAVLGADFGYGSVEVSQVTGGSVDYIEGGYNQTDATLSEWNQIEFIVDDPNGTSPQFTTRILNTDGSVRTEVSNDMDIYTTNPQYMGFVSDAPTAQFDELYSDAYVALSPVGTVSVASDGTIYQAPLYNETDLINEGFVTGHGVRATNGNIGKYKLVDPSESKWHCAVDGTIYGIALTDN